MKVLVTGAAGFIGSHLVNALIAKGDTVTTIDNDSASCNEEFHRYEKAINYHTDICNSYNLIGDTKPDVIYHLAAESRIENAKQDPTACWNTNVMGTLQMLRAAVDFKVPRFIYSSTSAAYGTISDVNFTGSIETDPINCLNHYAESKIAAERLCMLYYQMHGLKTTCLRYFNVYGPRQPTKGLHAPVLGVFEKCIKEDKPFTIVGNGHQRRDFVHVSDVVAANIKASVSVTSIGEIFNIGSGKNYSILELAKLVHSSWPIEHIPGRSQEANITLANIEKARLLLGWVPDIDLKDYLNEANSS